MPDTSYNPVILHQMSNQELKVAERKLADKMRKYQAEHDGKVDEILKSPDAMPKITQEEDEFRGGFL